MALDARTERIYDTPEPSDGARVLVDRSWPGSRSVSRPRNSAVGKRVVRPAP
jgi:uncharacterized protein YeaO (DUF488 family)